VTGQATHRPDPLDVDDVVVVVAGVAMVGLAMVPWYTARAAALDVALRGWDLGFASVVGVLLAAYAAVRVLYTRGRPPKPDVPVTPQAETFAAAAIAALLVLYRVLDVPTVAGAAPQRTGWLTAAAAVVVVQAVCAARKLGRTGLRATPPA
jgi:cytochrome b561